MTELLRMYVSIEDIILKYHKSSNHLTNKVQDFHINKGKRNRNQKLGCHFSGVDVIVTCLTTK